jgi:hypothetical protein
MSKWRKFYDFSCHTDTVPVPNSGFLFLFLHICHTPFSLSGSYDLFISNSKNFISVTTNDELEHVLYMFFETI